MRTTQINHFVKNVNVNNANLQNLLNSATVSTVGMGSILSRSPVINTDIGSSLNLNPNPTPNPNQINLVEFTRLYKIGPIPVIDFIIIYICFYLLNSIYFDLDYKIILIATIPLTILFNLITNANCKVTNLILLILIVSTYYLITCCTNLMPKIKS